MRFRVPALLVAAAAAIVTSLGAMAGARQFPAPDDGPAMRLVPVEGAMPDLLQVGDPRYAYWIEDGVWGAKGMTRGRFTGTSGTTYQTAYGASTRVGPHGEIGWRSAWKFPDTPAPCGPDSDCYQEIKAYPSAVFGAKPGWANPANMPGGAKVRLWPGTQYATTQTKTPGSFLPLPANGALPPIWSTFSYRHVVPPEGKGQLTYDLWLQSTPAQCHGMNNCKEITHEIMIPVAYWGDYGKCGSRNEAWKVKDARGRHRVVTIDGRDWCLYLSQHMGGTWDPQTQSKSGGWTFVVFEPMTPLPPAAVHRLNLSSFVNFLSAQTDDHGARWAAGTEHLVSVEFGAEVQVGVGDTEITNYRVWKP